MSITRYLNHNTQPDAAKLMQPFLKLLKKRAPRTKGKYI